MKKVCLTTFIYGIKYQSYIPTLLYSLEKAYPKYDVILFLYEKLDPKINQSINSLNLTNKVTILEEQFTECKKMTPPKSQSLRWVLWHDDFENYDYLYTVDIDILYIKEPTDLHIQHEEHMKVLDLPFSNIRRKYSYNPYSIKTLAKRIKMSGFSKLKRFFIQGNKQLDRLTGLHFVSIPEYYSALTPEIREKFKNDILNDKVSSYIMLSNDEALLAYIVKYIGFDISKLGYQTKSNEMLDFNNYKQQIFRPTHGIHLGVLRAQESLVINSKSFNSEYYSYYFDIFKSDILSDKIFRQLLKEAPDNIKSIYGYLFRFLNIEDASIFEDSDLHKNKFQL
jgi:hypothetical protein